MTPVFFDLAGLKTLGSALSGVLMAAGVSGLAGLAAPAQAQAQAIVPFYTPGDLMRGVHRYWYAPQAAQFAKEAASLPPALTALCQADAAVASAELQQREVVREQWKATALAWERLSGVQIGPLVQRRSARQIDFMPTRPELVKRAIQAAPADAKAMESIGSPAKGLPALEWLLWSQPVAAGTPACDYAIQVAADIQREAEALAAEFGQLAARKPGESEETNALALSELVNQWTGGLERLRWSDMEKPRMAGASRHAPAYARSASGQTGARWAAHWQALRTLGTLGTAAAGAPTPQPGAGLVPLETYIRGLGRNEPADQLAQRVDLADKAMRQLSPANPSEVASAARAIAEVKKVAESEVAPAMEVSIGFSDADGD